jgi:hypothetical protein
MGLQNRFGIWLGSALLVFSSLGCTTPYHNPNLPNLATSSEYYSAAEDSSGRSKVYDGFMQTMELSATLLNTRTARLQVEHKARIYQWPAEQYSNNKSEVETSLSRETKVFLSFFVPERKHDDLHKPRTLWKIFLDAGGRRYEGRAERMKTILAEVQSLYPNHTRFQTPYIVTFQVPMSQVENSDSKLTLTGPVGSTSIQFKPAQ